MSRIPIHHALRAYAHAPAGVEAPAFVDEYALAFDGIDEYAEGTADLPTFGVNGYTLSLWMRYTDSTFPNYEYPFQIGTASDFFLRFRTHGTDVRVDEQIPGGTSNLQDLRGYAGLQNMGWRHICISSTSTTTKGTLVFYVDGVPQTLADFGTTGSSTGPATRIRFGAPTSGSGPATVTVSEASWWNEALDATEVSLLYNDGSPLDIENTVGLPSTGPSSTLAHWWRFGDGAGDASDFPSDDTIYDQVGTCHLTSTNTESGDIVPSNTQLRTSEKSIKFNGSDEYAYSAAGVNLGTGPFTVSGWFKATATQGNLIWFASGSAAGSSYGSYSRIQIGLQNVSAAKPYASCQVYVGDGTTGRSSVHPTGTFFQSDTWQHILVSCTSDTSAAGTVTCYLNGIATSTTGRQWSSSPTYPAHRLTVGANNIGNGWCAGHFDEITTWNVALSASDAAALYNFGRPPDVSTVSLSATYATDCTHHYKMGDGDPAALATITDSKGSDDLTTVNMDASNVIADGVAGETP